ncbi:MAG: DEAD/DEAH box helicase [candidate division KSB1 bacterium]|nr:DEAD/DEAH box helicase [candidate division KSB1 bacterium]MDZ7367548.1 DEAD/DEAH box helicase [candidate division KSB1 bacterium]MDZ7404894.1 DEAD/DEAH box helicase [candidate division KSB1 bacterium]
MDHNPATSNEQPVANFHPAVSAWFTQTFGKPSPPQERGWPEIAAGKNVLILAPTGSGKTLAAFLWCINDLLEQSLATDKDTFEKNYLGGIHTLYISPLKALNNDVEKNLQAPLTGIRETAMQMQVDLPQIRVLVRTGDTPSEMRQKMLKRPPHILITTPESLFIMLTSERAREMYRTVKYVIVDEIHALCGQKRGVHLSLSLERLAHLCRKDFVRIGLSATQRPLERIAAFLGGQNSRSRTSDSPPSDRPVEIIDCGQKKDVDLKIISAVEDYGNLPDDSIWPAITEKLYGLIQQHRTTLIFTLMRAQAEKIAKRLNDWHHRQTQSAEELVQAHHGSLSKEVRLEMEDKLKRGALRALAATSSLELGIDIGSIDCVVQLGSPKSVSRAMQRVGRSGRLISATSKGRFFPLFRHDIGDLAMIARGMFDAAIEETHVPENCLDVLAQQIVAAVSVDEWNPDELYQLVRQSYCYRQLSRSLFESVLDMLSGKYPSEDMRELRPKIAWDRVNNRLIARRGARHAAIMNGGTIPDRGYYGVYIADTNIKVGEMEEEFVFESKVGDIFYLGSSEWRITSIEHDRFWVTPAHAERPRPPFWRGDSFYRDYETGLRVGAFRRKVQERMVLPEALNWLMENFAMDRWSAENLLAHFDKQIDSTGTLPTDQQIIVEQFYDEIGDPRLFVHSVFGGKVNAPWAFALQNKMEELTGVEVQSQFDDDGLMLRFIDTDRPPALEQLLSLTPEEIEERNLKALSTTPPFAIRFRYNAARALMLPRTSPKRRMPLWQQRLRAADLLQAVRKYDDFPLIIETYRDCLRDALDLESLKRVIADIHAGKIAVHFVQTEVPSPFTGNLLYNFLANYMYDFNEVRLSQHAAAMEVNRELLHEALNSGPVPAIISPELVENAEKYWQYRDPQRRARNAEDLLEIINVLGDATTEELRERCDEKLEEYLNQLQQQGRIMLYNFQHDGETQTRWVSVEQKALYEELF